ncbi:MAG TPA: hypothetical protein VNZ61_16600 [Roseomonas sp.]|nr:hypothetical protein [Roseomonas sp.]
MATRADSTTVPASRRRLSALPAAPRRRRGGATGLGHFPTRPQRALAYLANGDLPPLPRMGERLSVSALMTGYVAAVALGGLGFGLMLAGGLI